MKKILPVLLFTIVSLLPLSANAARPWTLKQGVLVCPTEQDYKLQVKSATQGINDFVGGCGVTEQSFQVVMIELNMISPSHARIPGYDIDVWADHSAFTH